MPARRACVAIPALCLAAACGYTPASQWGRGGSPVPEVTDPPAAHKQYLPFEDRDGDGKYADPCPTEKEDFDGFEDGDGCPDPDNDQDGVLDPVDRCPDVASTRADGCVEELTVDGADLDRDGVTHDACPGAAEDLDGFEDEDGCPERDNDADGINDARDACPDFAEDGDDARGGDRHDGCPR